VQPYHVLRPANVAGTETAIRLAATGGLKPLHHISTIAVFENSAAAPPFEERPLGEGGAFITEYAQSKWVAERLVQAAGERGIPVAIYRLGNMLGALPHGVCNTNDFLFRLLKGCIQLGAAPETSATFDLTPVDYASRSVAYLALRYGADGQIYHLVNQRPTAAATLLDWVRAYGYPIRQVAADEWERVYLPQVRDDPGNALYPFVAMADGPGAERSGGAPASYACERTLAALQPGGISCPPIDRRYVEAALTHAITSGWLPAPAELRQP
jgi:thioester reductase-like protein